MQRRVGQALMDPRVRSRRHCEKDLRDELGHFGRHATEVIGLRPVGYPHRTVRVVAHDGWRRGKKTPCPERFYPLGIQEFTEEISIRSRARELRDDAVDLLRSWLGPALHQDSLQC